MNLQTFAKIFLLILVVGACFSTIEAQTNSCGLSLRVFAIEEGEIGNWKTIVEAKAEIVNLATKKKQSFSVQTNSPQLPNIIEGNYKVAVKKNGFKSTNKQIEVDCRYANIEGVFSEVIFLWKGKTTQTVEMNSSVMNAVGHSESFETQQQESSKQNQTVNGKAVVLKKPSFPIAARAVKATGAVSVQVVINELGEVIFAEAKSGHPLLRSAAVGAAKGSQFLPTILNGNPIKVTGFVVYNFTP
jgi:outer membrane biosynthesis protein TonB